MALLDELGRRVLQADLLRRRHIVEVGVLHQRVEPVVVYRTIGITDDCLGEAAVIEGAERAVAGRMVELAEQAAARVHLVLEAVLEQPGLALRSAEIELLDIVVAVLDSTRELNGVAAIADLNTAGYALRLRARLDILQRADVRIDAETPLVRGGEVDARGMSESCSGIVMPVPFLEVHARAVGKP